MKRLLLLLLLTTPAFAQLEAPGKTTLDGSVAVPMAFGRHVPIVDVKINGEGPFRFELDTGMQPQLSVTPELRDKLKLARAGEMSISDPSGRNPQQREVVGVASVDLGGARFEGLKALVRPMRHVDGMLGWSLFRDVLLTLDYPKKELRLARGALPAADGKRVLPLVKESALPMIEIAVAGKTMNVDIDAGSPSNVTVPLAVAKGLPFKSELAVIGRGRTVSGEFDVYGGELQGEVKVGALTLSEPRVSAVEHFPHGNLGYRFLQNYAVTFDQRNQRVEFVQ